MANISRSLAYYSGLEPVYGGDIVYAARMLKHMAERMHYEIQVRTDEHSRNGTQC